MLEYDKIILMGSKTTAYKCAQVVARKASHVHFYENQVEREKIPLCYLEDASITWHICLKNEWRDLLSQEKEKTLFISVINQSILPKEIIENKSITFINLHSAILPNYRGRNCSGWALFNEEEFTGVTWHYLTEKVDEGNLLWQSKISISENDTSLSLFRKQNNLSIQLLEENIERFLHEKIKGEPQNDHEMVYYYFAKDKPNNGILDLNWSGRKISCFLRAMDFGPLYEFGVPMIELNNKYFLISSYKIEMSDFLDVEGAFFEADNEIIIKKNNYKFKLIVKENN